MMTKTDSKAIIYCRDACAEQVRLHDSVSEQEMICRLYAEKLGHEVVEVFSDDEESGLNAERPALNDMLKLLALEPCMGIAQDISRISRNPNELVGICETIASCDSEIVFVAGDNPNAARAR